MEIYIIGICIALFVAYKVHSETQKKMRSSLSLGAKPKVSDYANTFFSLLFSLAKDAAKGGMNELNKNANKSYSEKKSAGKSSQLGTIKVAGGLLPKHGSIGTIEFYFDGDPLATFHGCQRKNKRRVGRQTAPNAPTKSLLQGSLSGLRKNFAAPTRKP